MNRDVIVSLTVDMMQLAFKVALPVLGVGLIVGLVVSVFQAVTQIQEQSLSFIPKLIGLAVVIVVFGPWMLDQLIGYTTGLYSQIPQLTGA